MGLFGSTNNPKPRRVFSVEGNEYHQPKSFGYLSVKAAHELAIPTLKAWFDATADKKLFAILKARPAALQLQLVALLIAAHYIYANITLRVPQDVLAEMRDGIAQGIDTLTSGHEVAESFAQLLHSSIADYVQALNQDISHPLEPGTIEPGCGPTALTFTVLLGELYKGDEYNKLVHQPDFFFEDTVLQHLVRDAWLNLMTGLQETFRVKFLP